MSFGFTKTLTIDGDTTGKRVTAAEWLRDSIGGTSPRTVVFDTGTLEMRMHGSAATSIIVEGWMRAAEAPAGATFAFYGPWSYATDGWSLASAFKLSSGLNGNARFVLNLFLQSWPPIIIAAFIGNTWLIGATDDTACDSALTPVNVKTLVPFDGTYSPHPRPRRMAFE